jgi:uroporphyrinogen-III decarboxylase
MTPRERFLKVINFEKPDDRMPMVEWAAWWDLTLKRWREEGMPANLSFLESQEYFGLDPMILLFPQTMYGDHPKPSHHGAPIIRSEEDYEGLKKYLYTDESLKVLKDDARALKEKHDKGEIIIRLWLEGFFWFPRTLFGIEEHFYAFYDNPGLMHRINQDLARYNIRVIEEVTSVLIPDMVGFAEDMSYNHGPMLSYDLFSEFLMPYYKQLTPHISSRGIKILVDSDGDVTEMIPWLKEAGIEGIYPLERQAGVDLSKIRADFPDFLMLGGYDKMVMSKGREAMRAEFERLLPVMKTGGYVPSVDHQTPPGVSLENYRIYIELLKEYARKAVL